MMADRSSLLWEQPAWRQEAIQWITERLAEHGLHPEGSIEQPHIRPWSTVLRVTTEKGVFYFKANSPDLVREAGITDLLTHFRPGLFPQLLGVDLGRGWLLMEDAGTPLRVFIRTEKSLRRWDDVMPLYTRLQKDLAAHTQDLLAVGMNDRRLERLPGLFKELLEDHAAIMLGEDEGLTMEQYERLKESLPLFAEQCAQVAALGIPETIHHDDFHDGNIFIKDGRILFTDWGESAVTHPFLSLVVMLRGAGNSLEAYWDREEAGPDTPEIVELRRLYLRDWTTYAPLPELEAAARLAERKLGYVNRALSWCEGIQNMPPEMRGEYAMAVPAYLQEYLTG